MKNLENLPHESGIYLVTNLVNNKKYIGQSLDILARFKSHHLSSYKNPKDNCYNTKFYQALRKYGIENFKVEVLEFCPKEKLDGREIYYIKFYNSFKNGYNSTEGGQNWSPNIHSEETEEKRRLTREKNGSLQGDKHPRAKMTNEEVISIRERYKQGEHPKAIYEDYKDRYSNYDTFRRIILGYTYKNVGNSPSKSEKRYTNARFTPNQVRAIREEYETSEISFSALGRKYGVTDGCIRKIVKRESYKNID